MYLYSWSISYLALRQEELVVHFFFNYYFRWKSSSVEMKISF